VLESGSSIKIDRFPLEPEHTCTGRLLVAELCSPGTDAMLWAYTDIVMDRGGKEGRGRIRRSVKHSIV
jgi:hypothetical protein